jgi:ABC-type amino acid transport system permease subunit
MRASRLGSAAPYAVLLATAGFAYVLAGRIDYGARPGQIGPDFWPKVAIGLIAFVCLFEIVKVALGAGKDAHGIGDQLSSAEEEDEGPRRLPLLLSGVVITIAYGALIPVLGFPVTTFVYMVGFMYLGGFRSHLGIWLSSFLGVAVLSVLFLKVVYVSLPRGIPPFDRVTDFIVALF